MSGVLPPEKGKKSRVVMRVHMHAYADISDEWLERRRKDRKEKKTKLTKREGGGREREHLSIEMDS